MTSVWWVLQCSTLDHRYIDFLVISFFLSPFFSFGFCSFFFSPLPSLHLLLSNRLFSSLSAPLLCYFGFRGYPQGGSSLSSSVMSSSARRVRQLPQLPPQSSTVEQGIHVWLYVCVSVCECLKLGERSFVNQLIKCRIVYTMMSFSLCNIALMQYH